MKQVQNINGIPSLISKIHAENFEVGQCKKAVVLIPGNPGVIRFYESFLESLFDECEGRIPMFGIQHAGIHFCVLSRCSALSFIYFVVNPLFVALLSNTTL